jgi:hypothetical protein
MREPRSGLFTFIRHPLQVNSVAAGEVASAISRGSRLRVEQGIGGRRSRRRPSCRPSSGSRRHVGVFAVRFARSRTRARFARPISAFLVSASALPTASAARALHSTHTDVPTCLGVSFDAGFGSQPLNGQLRPPVLALTEVMLANASTRIHEVEGGPVFILECRLRSRCRSRSDTRSSSAVRHDGRCRRSVRIRTRVCARRSRRALAGTSAPRREDMGAYAAS